MGDACTSATLGCTDRIFMQFGCYALLDLFASDLLQDARICHTHDKA